MKILLYLKHLHAFSHIWEHLPASSYKTNSLLSSKTPLVMPAENLDNVLATHVLRLLSIMFINIVSFPLILSCQLVPSVASCDMCRLSSSQQQLTFSSVLVQHLAEPVLIHYRVPQGHNDTENKQS